MFHDILSPACRRSPLQGVLLQLESLEERTVPSLLAPLNYPVGEAPLAVRSADLDSDGLLDLVTANASSGTVSVLRGRGDGLFQAARNFPAGSGANSVTAADFDGDGLLDLATANGAAHTVSLLRGDGTGTFQAPSSWPAGQSPRSVAAGDFNGDGWADLVVLNSVVNGASLLLNQGDGSLLPPQALPVGNGPFAVRVEDFNADGVSDLAISTRANHAVSVLLGNGDGSFQVLPAQPTGRYPAGMTAADFNGDTLLDLAVATIDGATVLLGSGTGSFSRQDAPFGSRYYVTSLAAGDFNGDGALDLALGGADADIRSIHGGLSIQLGNGDGTFERIQVEDDSVFAADLIAEDFDQDGLTDLAAASYLRVCDDECSVYANHLLVLHGAGDGGWRSAPVFAGGRSPNSVAVGDFNGDGQSDLVTASFNGIGLLLGNGTGSFAPPRFAALLRTPFTLAVGDFNGDGALDVAATNAGTFPTYTNGLIHVVLGNGDGTFQKVQTLSIKSDAFKIATGDLNGDGVLDLIVLNRSIQLTAPASVTILLGVGDGSFVVGDSYETGRGIGTVAAADLNGDGLADVAVGISGNGSPEHAGVFVLLSQGDGTLAKAMRYTVGTVVQGVVVGDFTGDGLPDLAAALTGPTVGGVSVLAGNGDGSFAEALFTPSGRGLLSLAVGDLNGDGLLDLAGISVQGAALTVLLGQGSGTFQPFASFAVRLAPRDAAVADFNGDGWADVAVASNGTWPSYADGGINVLLNDAVWSAAPGGAPGSGDLIHVLMKRR